MPTRRSLLRRGPLALAALTGLAGCSGSDGGDPLRSTTAATTADGPTETDQTATTQPDPHPWFDGPEFAVPLYDPEAVTGAANTLAFAYDVPTVLSWLDRLPPESRETVSGAVDAAGVDLAALDRVSGVAGTRLGSQFEFEDGIATVHASGEVDAAAAGEALAARSGMERAGEHAGHDLFVDDLPDEEGRASVAVGPEAVAAGLTNADVADTRPVTETLDATTGDADGYYAETAAGRRALGLLAERAPPGFETPEAPASFTALEFSPNLASLLAVGVSGGRAVVEDLATLATTGGVDGDAVVSTYAFAYEDETDVPEADTLREAVTDLVGNAEGFPAPTDWTVTTDGKTATATGTWTADAAFAEAGIAATLLAPALWPATVLAGTPESV